MSGIWLVVLYVHLLSMAFFVGGQLVLGVAVVPAERGAPDRDRLRAIARRFGYGSFVALLLLIATGFAMASHQDRWSEVTLQVKLALVAAVFGLALAHLRWPRAHALQGVILVASLAIAWLGLELAQ
jgi:putative copper export protein